MANRALLAVLLLAAPLALAQQQRDFAPGICPRDCESDWQSPPAGTRSYAQLDALHRLTGLASYYSTFFDGRKTANGEIYRNRKYSAAHLTLPLGCWIEVTARATGKKLRLRVNDRGPYVKKFCLDLSQAAARFLGVDRADDRYIEAHVIAMPGEEPPAEPVTTLASATSQGQ